jgi:hypothetical protein
MDQPIRTFVHCFTAGSQTSAQGVTREFSAKDLKEVAESYDPVIHEAPVRIGHEDTDKSPAFGWVKGFKVEGDKLYADVAFTPEMSEMLRNGNYKKVSISMYSPNSHINPTPGKWSARHLAVLGATPPAVKGLEAIQFSEEVFDYSDGETLESFYDPELGPTLESDNSPIQTLKEVLEEHKQKSTVKDESMTDEQNLEVNEELESEELETQEGADEEGTEEETEFAEGKKKMSKQGEEAMEDEGDEPDGDADDMQMSDKKKKGKKAAEMSEDHEEGGFPFQKKGKKSAKKDEGEMSEDHEEISHDSECASKKKKKGSEEYGDCDCQHEESEDEIAAAHGEETGRSKGQGVADDRLKKGKSEDVQGKGGVEGPKKGKAKEADGYGKSATHSYAKVPSTKHAYPKGVEVDYEEQEVSEDHYESPMEMTGDTRMANVVEQITKENQLEAMMKQIEHLSGQVKLITEENDRLRQAAEKAMKDKRRQELQSFVSSLYESGKLTDAVMTQEKLVGFAESLDSNSFDFGEGEEQPASQVLLNLLANLPAQVAFGEFGADNFEFEEEEDLSPHELATRIATEESISYVDALKRVLY